MRKFIMIFCLAVLPILSEAQSSYAYLAWDYNAPLSNKEYVSSSSPHGGVLGFRYFIRDGQLSLGLELSSTTFDQYEPARVYPQENGHLYTDLYRYLYQYGAVVNAQFYHPVKSEIFFPYYGLGIGANYNRFDLYYNIYEESESAWGLLLRPEAGILVRFGEHRSLGAIAAVHYDYSTVKNPTYDISGFSSVGVKVGIVLMGRD